MASYSVDERYDMFCAYMACDRNAERSSQMYFNKYPERRQPHISQFGRLARQIHQRKHFSNVQKSKGLKEETEINVLASLEVNDRASSRQLASIAGTSQMTAIRVLHKNKFKPYHVSRSHTLHHLQDPNRRSAFCGWFLNQAANDGNFPRSILWTDETRFTNCGIFNRHNEVLWRRENPHTMQEVRPQVKFGFNVWCGLFDNQLIGPIIYNDNLNGERYLHLLQNSIQNELDELPLEQLRKIQWFQQDGAPAHNTRIVTEYLQQQFPGRWIGTNGPVLWPARSPDLTPLDFFLWGYLKDKVYNTVYNTIEELEEAVRGEIFELPRRHIRKAIDSVSSRCNSCLQNNGRQFEYLN